MIIQEYPENPQRVWRVNSKIERVDKITLLKKMKIKLLLVLMITYTLSVTGQELLTPSNSFSHKKTSYITLTDGTEIKGSVKSIDRKKGLIKQIKIEDGNGEKIKLKPTEVAFMYLPPSGLDNLTKSMNFLGDATKWNNEKLDQDLLNKGYVFFESSNVKIKKKQSVMLMQLLNPSFSGVVKVYHDPFAKQTMSVGVAGVKVAGGIEKSYFVKTGDAAFKLEKKAYKKEFKPLWSKCEDLAAKGEIKWNELTNHVITYSECVN